MTSIRRQLVVRLLPAIVCLALVSGSGLYLYIQHVLTEQFDAALEARARAVAALVHWDDSQPAALIVPDLAGDELASGRHGNYFEIWNRQGQRMARSAAMGQTDLPAPLQPASSQSRFWNLSLPDNRAGRVVRIQFLPVCDEDDKPSDPGPMVLALAQSRWPLDEPLRVLMTSLLVATSLMTLGIIAIVAFAVRRSLKPLGVVADEIAASDPLTVGHRFPVDGMPRELAPVCRRLNELLAGLEEVAARERRVTDDIAHELRTPIAELRSMAEVQLRWPDEPAKVDEAFQEALSIARRMQSVVTALLALARSRNGSQPITRQIVEVGQIVQSAWRSLETEAQRRSLTVAIQIQAEVMLDSNSTLLQSIMSNLLANAVAYTPAGGEVLMRVLRREQSVMIEIENSADGLTQQDLPRLFEPFWRKDSSRTDGSHSGLGLTLTAQYVKTLGGEIRAQILRPGRLRMTVEFPAGEPCQSADPIDLPLSTLPG